MASPDFRGGRLPEAQALEASVQVQVIEEKRSRRFEHAASVAVVAVALPALIFTALAVPASIPGWVVMALGSARSSLVPLPAPLEAGGSQGGRNK
jgi:hypothetical protein